MTKFATVAELEGKAKVTPEVPGMSRKDKLLRLADIVGRHQVLNMFHLLEHPVRRNPQRQHTPDHLDHYRVAGSIFDVAGRDPVLLDAGLPANPSVTDGMKFFEVTLEDLHRVSCDCGGIVTGPSASSILRDLASR